MKKIIIFATVTVLFIGFYACNKSNNNQETILKGKATILVDETILPIMEDQVAVFESQYKAKITLIGKSETEIIQLLSNDKNRLAILTRELSKSESAVFDKMKIKPRITSFGTDGIAFIGNKNNPDSIISLQKVITFVQGKNKDYFEGLVFDNSNSSSVRLLKQLSKVTSLPKEKIYSFKTNNEVIDFVAKNEGMIGLVGVNWITQPMSNMKNSIKKIQVLSVYDETSKKQAKPSQDNIAAGLYPLTREIKMLNYQGSVGLGMGFASFVAGEIGQRIILKSGLVPVRVPSRSVTIRKEIIKKENK